ncbi:MAG: ubiquitin-like small modifier protein 1 [Bacillota bacterium]
MVVKLFGSLRLPGVGSRVEVSGGATVAAVLESLFAQHPQLREHVVQPDRFELLPHVNLMLNGRLVRDLEGLQTRVAEADSIAIFPPSAGG